MKREIWDEHQWEEFLRESDKRTELYHQLFEAYVRDNPPPEETAPADQREQYWETLHEHLAQQMGWDLPDSSAEPDFLEGMEEEDEFEDDDFTGEEWKSGLGADFPEEQDFEELPIYQKAFDFGQAVYAWVDTLPGDQRESAIVELCSSTLQVAAKIAGGHGMGYDLEVLGGNIAQCKRALAAANRALDALRVFRDSDLISEGDYRRLYEYGFEVRNEVGVYVQELRERFERGVE